MYRQRTSLELLFTTFLTWFQSFRLKGLRDASDGPGATESALEAPFGVVVLLLDTMGVVLPDRIRSTVDLFDL